MYTGGMKMQGEDNDKKKTPGGVFMVLIKKSPEYVDLSYMIIVI